MQAKGHTLIELLIAMALSMIIIAALIPVNLFSLRSIVQIQSIEKQIHLLSQSLVLFKNDLSSTALSGCTLDKNQINNSLIDNEKQINWITGYTNTNWFPETPIFVNDSMAVSFDAIQVISADMSKLISTSSLVKTPDRIVFITNCITSEIARADDSRLLKSTSSDSDLSIYAFQINQYFIKENSGKYTLYRQYISKSGRPTSEPLVDNIERLKIAYAEKFSKLSLIFTSASKVKNWSNIVAVYVSISLKGAVDKPFSLIIRLSNHSSLKSAT